MALTVHICHCSAAVHLVLAKKGRHIVASHRLHGSEQTSRKYILNPPPSRRSASSRCNISGEATRRQLVVGAVQVSLDLS